MRYSVWVHAYDKQYNAECTRHMHYLEVDKVEDIETAFEQKKCNNDKIEHVCVYDYSDPNDVIYHKIDMTKQQITLRNLVDERFNICTERCRCTIIIGDTIHECILKNHHKTIHICNCGVRF
ncbi:MAG: hypothetical protein QXV17_06815 [Candidatus Micrarchaeaceae archaeon]